MANPARDALHFPSHHAQQIDPYIPTLPATPTPTTKPHVTLTFATSLDSQLSLAPGIQTALSGPESKAMTHYLRSKHDAILIGVGTAVADNPSLNCRIEGVGGYGGEGLEGQPRPVVIDPKGRWTFSADSKVLKLAAEGKGRAPWVVAGLGRVDEERRGMLESLRGKVLEFDSSGSSISWSEILNRLVNDGVKSVMIEGGGGVINELLAPENVGLVDSVILTIAPVWLGKGGVQVCPDARVEDGQRLAVSRLKDVKWVPLGDDVVLCGHPRLA
ncbi:bacterial bifunctional deaminase-reductase [Ophiobolus disseminans]|uniref:2,5-diamino-6-ribosylamino-4(3H)-pyrimidinone 5'-phosphate reductase n=1 Tax=Ophiobolus disseminans TaxID=1469910 RepID=A0A6A7ACI0_9PLEO|nr:bacterial bifunctional deaminase-reductase [Ophiobolus disseminans]